MLLVPQLAAYGECVSSSFWKFQLDANDEEAARKVFNRCLSRVDRPCLNGSYERYEKGGYIAQCSFFHGDDTPWSQVVVEVISFAEELGSGWMLFGSISEDPSGVLSLEAGAKSRVSGLLWSEWQVFNDYNT